MNIHGPPNGRLLFLIPDLWPPGDQALFHHAPTLQVLGGLVERRTGVRPTFDMPGFWAITVPASQQMLTLADDEKAVFLDKHETRPIPPGQWD